MREGKRSALWKHLQDLVHVFLKSLLQNPISFIDNEHEEPLEIKSPRIAEVVYESTRSSDNYINTFTKLVWYGCQLWADIGDEGVNED